MSKEYFEKFAEKVLPVVLEEAEKQGITQGAITVALDWVHGGMDSSTVPIGSSTVYREDDGREVGDCAGVTHMKIAACKKAIAVHTAENCYPGRDKYTSGALPEEYVGNGRINWKGAIGIPVGGRVCGSCCGVDAFTVYVAVSGGTQDQDELAAWAALNPIREVINETCFTIRRDFWPKYDAVNGILEALKEEEA